MSFVAIGGTQCSHVTVEARRLFWGVRITHLTNTYQAPINYKELHRALGSTQVSHPNPVWCPGECRGESVTPILCSALGNTQVSHPDPCLFRL